MDSVPFRETIRRSLARDRGATADASDATRTLALWNDVADRLVPVIGSLGVEALLGRALHLAGASFPWLGHCNGAGEQAPATERLRACLAAHDAAAPAVAGEAIIVTFIELLAAMIGESLTARLLAPVLAAPPAWSEPETKA